MDLSSYSLILFIVLCGFCGLNFAEISATSWRKKTNELPANLDENYLKSQEINLTFPGCGFRLPKEFETDKGSSDTNKIEIEERIVGGGESSENSWPWMVALFKKVPGPDEAKFYCGASLISKKYVLTAAHCFDNGYIKPSRYFVVVGSHNTHDGTAYGIRKILIHPDYKDGQYYNDITLLEIDSTVELSKTVYPVCLPSHGLEALNQTEIKDVTVTGWGDTGYGGESSRHCLQEVTIPLVSYETCNDAYSVDPGTFPEGITELFICAGVKEGGKDACQGDSGGPLVAKLEDDSYVQLGVVSCGMGCGEAGFPGVYTNVMQYVEWLYDNTDLGK